MAPWSSEFQPCPAVLMLTQSTLLHIDLHVQSVASTHKADRAILLRLVAVSSDGYRLVVLCDSCTCFLDWDMAQPGTPVLSLLF